LPPAGFDFGNSPTQTKELELGGRSVIQRTGAGTQGIVRSVHADVLLAASLAVAGATVRYIRKLEPASVTFVVTGQFEDGRGDEDLACAEFLAQRLLGRSPDLSPYLKRVTSSRDALLHLDPDLPAFPRSDLDYCAGIDTFDFAMPVNREDGRHVIRPARM
jgi:2-phosphosulfolactate phosphatase